MKAFNKAPCVVAIAMIMMSSTAMAKVSKEEASQLGDTLTPVGALVTGNKDGSIPAWTGGITNMSLGKNYGENERVDNPYIADQPLFTITADNVEQYKNNLTPGQMAMFSAYPKTYKMPIYQTRRSFALKDDMYDVIKANATTATLTEEGNGVSNYNIAIPFPIPKNGLEVIWNHITRYRGGRAERVFTSIPVQKNGGYTKIKSKEISSIPETLRSGRNLKKDDNIRFYYIKRILEPARLTGTVTLVHETMDQVKEPRKAWIYNAGQRRVRRAPSIAYDSESTGSEGLATMDNFDMYNGAPDRYNWKLVGKKELYVPYNAYQLSSTDLSYDDIIRPGHINQEHTRYEKHRVWEVQATLKEGKRHVYAKRNFFIDEDSWQASIVDHYDAHDLLWRVSEAHAVQYYNVGVTWVAAEILYDLIAGRYLASGLANEERKGTQFDIDVKRNDFSIFALKRLGR
ncbi:DUF1329 domain-containing protein [Moritella sp. 36]|uniref:DUF1329 domain-containing protein n=1 Tax=Moritella sp. 36 TaxID=2746233 RepID=UPI001BA6784E|nr:DUF1329 domain-containing protein [Moritella sp. 36]QUM88341.1 DUF1329 domain-containing protein [Moritella sp. 36]